MAEKSLTLKFDGLELKLYGESAEVYHAARLNSGTYTRENLLFQVQKASAEYEQDHPYQREFRCLRIVTEGAMSIDLRSPWTFE